MALADIQDDGAVLGVERSLTGRRWRPRGGDARTALMLAQRLGVPEAVARVLAARGIDCDAAPAFLDPRLRDALPDPARLAGMAAAAARLAAAVVGGEAIALFGDYDVDGATGTALLARAFAALGVPVRVYIPDRMTEGYGPTAAAMLRLAAEGMRVVVTIDCGIVAFDALATAADAGLAVVVVDHHAAEARLPAAAAVVNPNRLDDSSGQGMLAAVGVAFLVAIALVRALREAGWFTARPEPDLMDLLDLVALGTVCDMVPLTGANRALVAQGLKVMARRRNIGLAALADVARIAERPGTFHAGFLLGPRINAGGRVGDASLGANLLMTRDPAEAARIAERLDALNAERREIEAAVHAEALMQAEALPADAPLVFAAGEGWHSGVVGIVAGRLKERFHRPAVVVAIDGEEGRGSGRSVDGVDLGAAFIAARQAGLLLSGGGHRMAAGLSVAREKVPELAAFLTERVGAAARASGLAPSIGIDWSLSLAAIGPDLAASLDRLAPYGNGNPEPRFAVGGVRVADAAIVGEDHVRTVLVDGSGARLKAMAFRAAGTQMGQALLARDGASLHVAGKLRTSNWQGRERVEFALDDAARP